MQYFEKRRERKIEGRVTESSEIVAERFRQRLDAPDALDLEEVRVPIGTAPKGISHLDFLKKVGWAAMDKIEGYELPLFAPELAFDPLISEYRSQPSDLTIVFTPPSQAVGALMDAIDSVREQRAQL